MALVHVIIYLVKNSIARVFAPLGKPRDHSATSLKKCKKKIFLKYEWARVYGNRMIFYTFFHKCPSGFVYLPRENKKSCKRRAFYADFTDAQRQIKAWHCLK